MPPGALCRPRSQVAQCACVAPTTPSTQTVAKPLGQCQPQQNGPLPAISPAQPFQTSPTVTKPSSKTATTLHPRRSRLSPKNDQRRSLKGKMCHRAPCAGPDPKSPSVHAWLQQHQAPKPSPNHLASASRNKTGRSPQSLPLNRFRPRLQSPNLARKRPQRCTRDAAD